MSAPDGHRFVKASTHPARLERGNQPEERRGSASSTGSLEHGHFRHDSVHARRLVSNLATARGASPAAARGASPASPGIQRRHTEQANINQGVPVAVRRSNSQTLSRPPALPALSTGFFGRPGTRSSNGSDEERSPLDRGGVALEGEMNSSDTERLPPPPPPPVNSRRSPASRHGVDGRVIPPGYILDTQRQPHSGPPPRRPSRDGVKGPEGNEDMLSLARVNEARYGSGRRAQIYGRLRTTAPARW
ncbi:hypothetical protein JCM10213_004606 [Rhodosporidiobolus nylandii]